MRYSKLILIFLLYKSGSLFSKERNDSDLDKFPGKWNNMMLGLVGGFYISSIVYLKINPFHCEQMYYKFSKEKNTEYCSFTHCKTLR